MFCSIMKINAQVCSLGHGKWVYEAMLLDQIGGDAESIFYDV